MVCNFCKEDPETITLVPARNGEVQDLSCIPCAIKHGLYCIEHNSAHRWFSTRMGGHTCMSCIEVMVQKHIPEEDEIYDRVISSLPPDQVERIQEWLEYQGEFQFLYAISIIPPRSWTA